MDLVLKYALCHPLFMEAVKEYVGMFWGEVFWGGSRSVSVVVVLVVKLGFSVLFTKNHEYSRKIK